MLTLDQLISQDFSPVRVLLRGGAVELLFKPLPAKLAALARHAFPRPRAPKVKNPHVGSAHPDAWQDDTGDPKYRAAFEEWQNQVAAAELALASDRAQGLVVHPDTAAAIAGVRAKAQELLEALTPDEIAVCILKLREAGSPGAADGIAEPGGGASGGDGELFGGLVKKLGPGGGGGSGGGGELPDEGYEIAEMEMLLRAASLFGQAPDEWIPRLTPMWRRIAVNHVRLRMAEEARKRAGGVS